MAGVMAGVIAQKGGGLMTFGSASLGNQQTWRATWPQSTEQAAEQEQIPGSQQTAGSATFMTADKKRTEGRAGGVKER